MKRKMMMITAALLAVAGMAKAQPFGKGKFGIKGGWNYANITNSQEGNIDNDKRLNTFNAGFVGTIPLGPIFDIRTGLDFQSKGIESSTALVGGSQTTFKSNPMYIELPVSLALNLPVPGPLKVYVGAGPYAAVGIAGKIKSMNQLAGIETNSTDDIQWGDDDPLNGDDQNGTVGSGHFKRFDFGANIIAGIEIGHLGVQAQYGLGLTNTAPGGSADQNSNKSNQHRVLGISGILYF